MPNYRVFPAVNQVSNIFTTPWPVEFNAAAPVDPADDPIIDAESIIAKDDAVAILKAADYTSIVPIDLRLQVQRGNTNWVDLRLLPHTFVAQVVPMPTV